MLLFAGREENEESELAICRRTDRTNAPILLTEMRKKQVVLLCYTSNWHSIDLLLCGGDKHVYVRIPYRVTDL